MAMPFSSFSGTLDPMGDCPKKTSNQEEDSVSNNESENKVLDDAQTLEVSRKKPGAKPTAERSSAKTLANNLEEGGEVVEGDPNSAMSFNFIYYIIDKFKFTDPLE